MTRVNDAILVTPGSGASLAMYSPGGSNTTEHLVHVLANAVGQVAEQSYTLQLPPVELTANVYLWEIFNGLTSDMTLQLVSVTATKLFDAGGSPGASNLGQRVDLFRTTALASGGTAFKFESSSTVSANFSRLDTTDPALPSTVTVKTRLTSITTGSHLGTMFLSRDTADANFHTGLQYAKDWSSERYPVKDLVIRPGQGVAARVGNIAASSVSHIWTMIVSTDP